MNKLQKRVIWISLAVLVITILYTAVLPKLKREKVKINDKEVEQAILEYANLQMPQKRLSVPGKAVKYKVEIVKLQQVTELPGPHQRRRVRCTLYGGYQMPGSYGKEGPSFSFSQKNNFIIANKYPSGISVQLDN
ncbi:MAG: hypothetical protein PHC50_10785 [Candidatus Cloacimonetes bacterium]|nr:hypothetical protein [Candidatus Cloacimonadota bacterium]